MKITKNVDVDSSKGMRITARESRTERGFKCYSSLQAEYRPIKELIAAIRFGWEWLQRQTRSGLGGKQHRS